MYRYLLISKSRFPGLLCKNGGLLLLAFILPDMARKKLRLDFFFFIAPPSLFRNKRFMLDKKWPSEMMLQNLPYFGNKKTQIVFLGFHFKLVRICYIGYVDIASDVQNSLVARNEKWKKTIWVFLFQKYGKFWSILLDNFIEHKLLISEECWYTQTT